MKFYLAGQTNFGNRGCEALTRTVISTLSEEFEKTSFLVPANGSIWSDVCLCKLRTASNKVVESGDSFGAVDQTILGTVLCVAVLCVPGHGGVRCDTDDWRRHDFSGLWIRFAFHGQWLHG